MIRKNHRRKGDKRTEHGSRWENGENDRNSSRSRMKWKRLRARVERRAGVVGVKFRFSRRGARGSRGATIAADES